MLLLPTLRRAARRAVPSNAANRAPMRPFAQAQRRAALTRQCSGGKTATAEMPDSLELRRLAIVSALPMVGFGFVDNLIMIQAGDLIDNSIGVKFGFASEHSCTPGQVGT